MENKNVLKEVDAEKISEIVNEANRNIARAHWWMLDVKNEDAELLGVLDKVKKVMALLRQADNLTLDISITIKEQRANTPQ